MENTFEELEGKVINVKFVDCENGDFMKLSKLLRSLIEYNNIVTFYRKHVKGCGHEELNILSKY